MRALGQRLDEGPGWGMVGGEVGVEWSRHDMAATLLHCPHPSQACILQSVPRLARPSMRLTSSPTFRKPWPEPSYTNSVALPPAALILSANAWADCGGDGGCVTGKQVVGRHSKGRGQCGSTAELSSAGACTAAMQAASQPTCPPLSHLWVAEALHVVQRTMVQVHRHLDALGLHTPGASGQRPLSGG